MRRAVIAALSAALILSGTAVAASFALGTYKGTTDQRGPMSMVIAKATMKSAKYGALFGCTDSSGKPTGTTQQMTTLPSAPIKHGKISQRYKLLRGSDLILLSATLKGKTVTGFFQEAYESGSGHTCGTGGKIHFTLKH